MGWWGTPKGIEFPITITNCILPKSHVCFMKKHGASKFSFGYAVVRADKNLTDQTLRVLSVHSCGLDVVSSYVKVFLCALYPRVLSTVIALRLMRLRARLLACNNLEKCVILW